MTFEAAPRDRRWTAPTTATGSGGGHGGWPRVALLAAALVAAAALFACQSSDVVPPTGSSLELTAQPATINAAGGSPQSTLSARVTNSLGVSLPGQTVVFNTTEGSLSPTALTPIETNSFGIAETVLVTFRTATVTATAGTTTETVTITVTQGDLNDILLLSDDISLNDCNENLQFLARAVDTQGVPINGLTITFQLRDKNGTLGSQGDFAGTFVPSSGVTQGNGEVTTNFLPDFPSCFENCASGGGGTTGGSCSAAVVAFDQSGTIESLPLVILDAVP